ncbi:hypothetical protein HPG69_010684 [Diceros bicornis minor]|uniref:Uncharacterized protein n=1 Tax=Diceros bicornis minor TaxID=77932 RepID=A0A7J7F130_DICBM|nr:hypothetical protein HPG69_010684 [Diceros bicornis minor]
MEVLDEFDSEMPPSVTFCQRISEEDFERQATTYTKRALRRLFRSIDRNPKLAERVVRKGKQAECERRGLLSFLWGELNYCNCVGAGEIHRRLEQLRRSIYRAHLYSQDAKKRRKRKLKKPEPILLRHRSTSLCLPPTLVPPLPLPPPATTMASEVAPSPSVCTMPRVFGPYNPLPCRQRPSPQAGLGPLRSAPSSHPVPCPPNTNLRVDTEDEPDMEKLEVSKSEVKFNCTGLSSNPRRWKEFILGLRTSACSGVPNTKETPSPPVKASVFKPPVLLKVQPVPRPKGDLENNPGSTESVPRKRSP